jgi:Xaa-Pro aminopeptidase
MSAKMPNFQRYAVASIALSALLWATGPIAVPAAAQAPFGRPNASIEAAKAPAVTARRAKLMEIHKDGLIIIPSQYKTRDGGMRDNINFLYLTGLKEAEAILVLDPNGDPRETIFRRSAGSTLSPRNKAGGANSEDNDRGIDGLAATSNRSGQIQDQGAIASEKGIVEKPNTQLLLSLGRLALEGRANRIYLPFSDFDFLTRTFNTARAWNPLFHSEALLNIDPTVAEMRLTKDADEIAALREAIDLTAGALNEAYRAAEPGVREIDLAAILRYAFDRHETEDSFLQVASGPNSTNVHFGATARALASGDLVVFDVGTWIGGYTSDISRTIPANGKFTKEQREIYTLVLEAQKYGCRRLVPGVTFKAVQTEVEDILMAGLEKLGLVTDVKSPWQRQVYIQHGFGHGIGLEIHDVWLWHVRRLDKVAMAPGMVMTMEPGLYFSEEYLEETLGYLQGKVPDAEIAAFREKVGPVYKKYAGMGVRIEDDVLITEGGNEMLSGGVPKEIAEIEKLMREKSAFN